MKKTLITLLALGSIAVGTTAEFSTLEGTTTQNGITMTDGVITASGEEQLYSAYPGRTTATTSFVLTFNLTNIEETTRPGNVELVTVATNSSTIGLYLQEDGGIIGRWANATNGTATTLATMKDNDNVFIDSNGDSCLALNFVLSLTTAHGGPGGFVGYDADATAVFSHVGLGSTGITSYSSITLNTDYITWAAIDTNPETTVNDVPSWAAHQIPASQLPIPEPTTATLSLLALAGLAVRRRRR